MASDEVEPIFRTVHIISDGTAEGTTVLLNDAEIEGIKYCSMSISPGSRPSVSFQIVPAVIDVEADLKAVFSYCPGCRERFEHICDKRKSPA